MSYCTHCERVVEGKREFSWLMFILWFILTIPIVPVFGALPYVIYWAAIKKKHCPICKMEI